MRYFIIHLAVILVVLAACSNGIEKEAKKHMEETMEELAKDPSSLQISNIETVFSNDSICILQYKCSAKNGFGGVSSSNYEYTYVVLQPDDDGKRSTYEMVRNIDEKKSLIKQAKESYQEKQFDFMFKDEDEEYKKSWYIYNLGALHAAMEGREVGAKESSNDIENW